ncbi:MAG TPA: zinc ribbon domain-containing protein [Actinomycetota bacterium]|nr:zinc ribbon domain-containing protein [Actinomycetota bacterium]
MPVYEYACTACGERLEARQSFDDPPLEECPQCGGKLRKLYSPVGIVFKGSGFYSTDAKSKSGKKTDTDKKKTEKAESKSESKASDKSTTDKKPSGSAEKSA